MCLNCRRHSELYGAFKMRQQNMINVSTILAELGWNEAHAIPVANKANQKLILRLEELQNLLFQRTNQVELESHKLDQLLQHTNNIKQEKKLTAELFNIRSKEINEEKHKIKLDEQKSDRLVREQKSVQRTLNEITERKSRLENLLFQKRNECDAISALINTNEETLESWITQIENRDEDLEIFRKYIKLDDMKVKELELEVKKLTESLQQKKQKMNYVYTTNETYQIELNNLCREVRIAYDDRDTLIKQWENVINSMKQRDLELSHFSERLNETKAELFEQKQSNREKLDFLHVQQENTSDVQNQVRDTMNNVARIKQELGETEASTLNFRSELHALKRAVDKAATDLESARAKSGQLKRYFEDKTRNLNKIQMMVKNLEENLKFIKETKLTAEQYANEADKQLSREENNQESLLYSINKLRDERFKVNQKLEASKQEEKSLKQIVLGNQTAQRTLNSKIAKLDIQLFKQDELIYRQDFHIQRLEHRVGKMSGEKSLDEQEALEAKIANLNKVLEEFNNKRNLLTTQLAHLKIEVNRKKRDYENISKKCSSLENQLQNYEFETDLTLKMKVHLEKAIQKIIVEKNLMRLELRKLGQIFTKFLNKKFDLENARLEGNLVVKERLQQISLHESMLNNQYRINLEENGQLKIEIQDRKSKIEKLIKRFEILTALMAPPEGEEARTQTYYIIKAAQEKELLQRHGDKLDNETRKLEQEVIALENTLALMNGCNTIYRMSCMKLTDDSDEIQEQNQLNEQIRVLTIKSRYDNIHLQELHDLQSTMQQSITHLDTEIELLKDHTLRLNSEIAQKSSDLLKRKQRLEKADERLQKSKRAFSQTNKLTREQYNQYMEDIKVRLTKELVTNMCSELLNRTKNDVEIYEQSQAMLASSGLPIQTITKINRLSIHSLSNRSHHTTPTPISSAQITPINSNSSSQNTTARDDPISENNSHFRININNNDPMVINTNTVDLVQQIQLPENEQTHRSTGRSKKQDQISGRNPNKT